jgi:hypothetical protein
MAIWVGPLSGRLAWIQKSGFPLLPKPAEPVALHQELVAKRTQLLLVERLAFLQIADPQANVVDH